MIYSRGRHISALLAGHHHGQHVVRNMWRKWKLSIKYIYF